MLQPLRPLLCMLAAAVLLAPGCAKGPVKADPELVAQLRERLVLAEEPEGAVTTLAWRETYAVATEPVAEPAATDAPADQPESVVFVGRVGGMPNPWPELEADFPWRAGQASFFLVDPATAAEFASHAAEAGESHDDCLFCAREAANKSDAVAAVRFAGPTGETAPVDARELFGLQEGDLVVVRGRPTLIGGDLMVVEATGVYVRR